MFVKLGNGAGNGVELSAGHVKEIGNGAFNVIRNGENICWGKYVYAHLPPESPCHFQPYVVPHARPHIQAHLKPNFQPHIQPHFQPNVQP